MKTTITNYLARNGHIVGLGLGISVEVNILRNGQAEFRYHRIRRHSELIGHAVFEQDTLSVKIAKEEENTHKPAECEKLIALALQKMMVLGD